MANKAASSSNGLIDNLTKSEFRKHIAEGPRDYFVLLFLTVLGPDSSCKICGQVHEGASELATQLNAARKKDGNFIKQALNESGERDFKYFGSRCEQSRDIRTRKASAWQAVNKNV